MIRRGRHKRTPLEDLSPYAPGHALLRPQAWRAGVIFASPHSGQCYPPDLIERARVSAHQLRRNEDICVDRLFLPAQALGAPLLCALFPRAVVDVNRAADELPAAWADAPGNITPRAAAGLGVVPSALSESLPIYSQALRREDVMARIATLYHPYHAALRGLIDEGLSRFGQVLLVDCHSMPGFAPMGARRPDIILGDRFGTSCHVDTLERMKTRFAQAGYSVGVNYPYAGGYTTAHYGQPETGVEAIQIEINRDLYVNPVTLKLKPGYDQLAKDLREIIAAMIEAALPRALAAQ
jgi:N-formylglutamate amidohydrolase